MDEGSHAAGGTSIPPAPGHAGSHVGAYECEICLEDPTEPVVTYCGHLYCWPCLYRWLRSGHSACPVCKSGVTESQVVPIYGRGRERVDPRTKGRPTAAGGAASGDRPADAGAGASAEPDVPNRPAGQRSEPPPNAAEAWPGGGMGGPQLQFTAGFGFFPSLFGLQFQAFQPAGRAGAPADPHQAFLDRVMLLLAITVLFFMLFL